MERFEPVADRVAEDDQVLDAALVGERTRTARNLDAAFFQMRRQRLDRRCVGDLPPVESNTLTFVALDNHALLAVVHAQRQRTAALVDELHAEKTRAVGRPLIEIGAADAHIAERGNLHSRLSLRRKVHHPSATDVQTRSARVVSSNISSKETRRGMIFISSA